MFKSPDKNFQITELYNYLKQKGKYSNTTTGLKTITSLLGRKLILKIPTEVPNEHTYKITDKGFKTLTHHFRESVYKMLLWNKSTEFTLQDIQGFYPFEVDTDMLMNITNDICKKSEILRPIHPAEGDLKFEITEKGQKARASETRNLLRGIDRKFRQKERSGSVEIEEVGLGGQVVNSYSTSKKSLLWTAILCPVLSIVLILILIFTR